MSSSATPALPGTKVRTRLTRSECSAGDACCMTLAPASGPLPVVPSPSSCFLRSSSSRTVPARWAVSSDSVAASARPSPETRPSTARRSEVVLISASTAGRLSVSVVAPVLQRRLPLRLRDVDASWR